jgi:hypothetical protein
MTDNDDEHFATLSRFIDKLQELKDEESDESDDENDDENDESDDNDDESSVPISKYV